MPKNRLEAFSDGIIAFAITLLILEIHIPDLGARVDDAAMLRAIFGLLPKFLVYVISFMVCTLTGSAFWLMRWYASTHGELMKPEIPKEVLRRRVRISLLSPLVYFIGAAISLFYVTFALLLYAAKRGRDEAAPVACALRRRRFGGVA
jgi:hypothetical protein